MLGMLPMDSCRRGGRGGLVMVEPDCSSILLKAMPSELDRFKSALVDLFLELGVIWAEKVTDLRDEVLKRR